SSTGQSSTGQSSTGQSSTGQSSTSKKISRASQRAFEILKEAGQPAPQKSAPQQADQVLKPQSHVPENKNVEKIFQKSNKSQQPVATSSDLENAAQLLINAANILANSATINASQKPKKTKSELESDKKTNKLLVEVKTASSEIKQAAVNLNKITKGFNDSINKIKAASLEIKQSANDLKNAAQLLANAVNVLTGSTQSAINSASDPKKPKSTNNDAELLQPKQDVLPKVKQQLDLAQSNIAKGLNNTVESLSNTAKAAKDFVQSQINQKINASLPSNAEQKTPLQLPTEQAQQLQQPVNIPQKSTKNEDITVLEPLPLELKQNINSVRLNTAKNIVASKRFMDATDQEGNAQLVPQKPINIEKINTKKQTSLDTTRDVFEIINDYFTAEYKKLKTDVDRAKKSGNLEDIDATRNKLKNFASHTEKAVTDIDAIVKQAEDQGYQKYINSELTDVHSKGKSPIRRKTKLANEMIGSLNYAEGQILEKDRKNYVAQAEKAGIEIPEGLKRGIVSNFDGVSAETKKLLNDFIKVVKKQLGIQSPSLVMFEIGMMIASGLFFGMQKGNSKVSEGARKMVTTIKSAFDPLNDLSSLGLAGTYMIPNLSDISNKAMIAMSATSTGLNMLDKVGEHHAANPDQTLFQATYGTAKNFVKDAVTDKSFVKPREAVDHLVNVAKFGTELVTPLGLKAFTNPIESANDGVAAAFRTMAIAKSLKQAHQDTKQQTQQDSTLNYASTFKNVLPQYLKANKIGRAEALKMFGGGLKVVPGMHGGNDANLYNAGAVAMGTAASLANATIGKFAPVANFVQTGKDVVKGLEQGILKNAGIATNAIATLGDSVQSQIKQNMGISSPSKVMIALGLMITSGLAVGIKKGIVDVSGASKLLLKVFDFVTKKINLFNSQDISSYDDIIKNSADGTAQTTKNVYDEANKVNKRTFFGSLLGAGMVAIGSTGILGDKVSAPFKHLGAYYQGNIDVHKIQGRTAREAEMAVMYQSMAEFAKANKKKEWKNLWGMAQKQTEMISDDWSVTSGVVGTSVAQIPEFKTLYKTLGGFNYGQNKEGGLQINDVYDWNAGEKKATKFKTPFGVAKKVNDFLIKHPKMAEKLGFTYNPKYKGYGINTKKAPLFAFLGDPDDPTLSNGNDIILGDAIHSVIGGKAYIQSHTTSQEKLRELQKKARTAFNRVQGNPVRFAEQPEIQSYLEGLDFGDAPSYNLLNLFGVNDVLNRRTAKNNLTKEKIESFKKSGAFPYEENIKHGKGLLEEFEKDKASNPLYSVAKFANKKGLNDYLLMSMHEQAGTENKLKLQKEIFKELSGRMPASYRNPVINPKGFFDNIKQMRKDGLGYKDIGINLISAFSEGVLTSAGSALATVILFAKNILSAVKKVFRIASPSGEG
ncbi:MAG: hypothetical protein ACOVQ3_09060, partial [Dolichospermum sp.]